MKYPKGKIAVVAAISGTLGKLLFAQIKSAQQAGFQVHGLCARGNDFDMLQKNGVLMYNLRIKRSISPFSDLVTIWDMYRYFRREKITIVHTHTPKAGLLGQLAAKLAGVPIIINTVHGYYFHENMKPLTRWFYIFMEWISARCSTMILSQNPEDVETAIKLGICKHNKIKLLGNGVDLFKFEPSRFDSDCRNKKRREIGLPEDAIVVGIIGRLVKEKGYLELYEAIKTLISTYDKVWLIIIGIKEPEKADRISHDAFVKYGIAHRTLWLGRRDDIPELHSYCSSLFFLR